MWKDFYHNLGFGRSKTSGEVKDICPLHDDVAPSLSINLDTGLWFCHACRVGGGPAQFLKKVFAYEAGEAAAEVSGYVQRSGGLRKTESVKPAKDLPSQDTVESWGRQIFAVPSILDYLHGRCITDETIVKYKIGFDGFRITIPIYDEHGNLVNIRRYLPNADYGNKMFNWPGHGSPPRLFPVENLRFDEIVLCEGEWDCLVAIQEGFHAVTTTAGCGTWLSSWNDLFAGKDVIIVYDSDEAGQKGARFVASSLVSKARSVRIVRLPVKDVTDYVVGGRKLEEAIKTAETVPDTIEEFMNTLPQNISFAEHQAAFKELCRRLVGKSPATKDYYINLIKERFGIGKDAIKREIRGLEVMEKIEPPIPVPLSDPQVHVRFAAQDMVDGVFHYCVYVPVTTGDLVPRIVNSKREMHEVPEDWIGPPDNFGVGGWSTDLKTEFNVFDYINGKVQTVDPREVFSEVRSVFERFMWYPDDYTYDLLSLWVMMTYVYMLFDTVGYLVMVGTKRSGKTRTLDLLEALSFNAQKTASLSPAFVFRLVHKNRSVVLFDEADLPKESSKMSDASNDLLRILRAGYKYRGQVGRVEGDKHMPKIYDVYSPKAISTIVGLEDALEDRAVYIRVGRKPVENDVDRLYFRRENENFRKLRNELYCFGLQHAGTIKALYESVDEPSIEDREAELFYSLLAIAKLVGDDVYKTVLEAAKINREEKNKTEVESYDCRFMEALFKYTTTHDPVGYYDKYPLYLSGELTNYIASEVQYDHLSQKRVVSDLRKLRILPQDVGRRSVRMGGSVMKAYPLDLDALVTMMRRYGVETDLE